MNACEQWKILGFADSELELVAPGRLSLRLGQPGLELASGPVALALVASAAQAADASVSARYECPGVCAVELTLCQDEETGWLKLGCRLANIGDRSLSVMEVFPVHGGSVRFPEAPRPVVAFSHGQDMCGFARLETPNGPLRSHACLGLSDSAGTRALALGFARLDDAFYDLDCAQVNEGALELSAVCHREGVALAVGATLTIAELLLGVGPSLSQLLNDYAAGVGRRMRARRAAAPQTGWCSWYYYYGTETEAAVLDNVAALAASDVGRKLRVIQIDDGWNLPEAGQARVWGDWTPGAKFAGGMRRVVERIQAHGFEAGLWLAPFSVDKASRLYREHPDWLVQDADTAPGQIQPAESWGVCGLDLSHPAALDFVRETFRRVFDEWGFTYIKIDFLLHALIDGRRHDPGRTTAELFRQGMAVIREVAGERFILNCGSPLGPAIGLCDAMRIGMDISSRWSVPMNLQDWPLGNCCVKAGANQVLLRQWMHGHWWQNDPDCLLVRDAASPGELHEFAQINGGEFLKTPPYGLSEEEAGCWARLVWLSGGLMLLAEDVRELPPERLALLRRCFPLNSHPARWLDAYGDPQVRVLRASGGREMVGIFNLADEPRALTLPAAKLGLAGSRRMREWVQGEEFLASGDVIAFPAQPAHSGRIWIAEPLG